MDVERLAIGTLFCALAACSGGAQKDAAAPKADSADAGSTSSTAEDGGTPGDGGKPFAGSAAEATQLITEAVDKKQDAIGRCVQQYRFRTHLAHEKVAVNIGIDQEGRLIGVTFPKGKQDKELAECVQKELRDAPFPRSHAGVITITRTFEEMVK